MRVSGLHPSSSRAHDATESQPAVFLAADVVIAVNPCGAPSPRLTVEAVRAGALGVLDLGSGDRPARRALERTARWADAPFGVRLPAGCALSAADLPELAATVLLGTGSALSAADLPGRRVLAEVTGREEALAAAAAGAHGLIARGYECGGRVGELSTFVLMQQLLSGDGITGADGRALPVWACGGIGPNTAAAAVAGGAAGVVLDTQLALLAESELPAEVAAALANLDGSETTVVHGHRVLQRRGPGAPAIPSGEDAAAATAAMIGGTDLRRRLLPIGQDGALAASFQRRWGTVGATVRGIRDAVLAALDGSAASALLPGSAASTALGTTVPVAQGPMTRVSDQAAFAAAVSADGGLPFIALALSGREQTRQVLEQTRDALGDRPWGVGVLGFAAEETKAAQLEIIREIRPSHAIIAGGRPAQAAALEEVGIRTFLHVPSPGLLKQFLAAGARRFIFEGSECGGHVGPRNSFPLWEAQLEVLTEFLANEPGSAADLQVLFAGGVHDERSSAMVAALAAPLTGAGAAVGVLMGTAYLFTEEAVAAGAIQPLFQRQVLAAERTDLLETAPGHATRCVHSPFTAEYAAIKRDLAERAVPDREAWEQLEQLNVGRLRLASKGIERVGDDLRPIDEDRQLAEGMFMAGEVAVLRHAVTTVAALHAAVSEGAAGFLAERAGQVRAALADAEAARPAPAPLDIAVVGMSCMFPAAPDLSSFWANVLSGTDAVTEVPSRRWDAGIYYDADGDGDKTPSRWGGFLPEIPFDPLQYGIPPTSLGSIEPVQLLALEAAQRALADAGYADRPFDRERTSVVFGAEAGSDLSNATTLRTVLPAYLGAVPPELDEQLPRLTEDSFPGVLANVISGRIANRLDLGGANYTVDAACASSLTAVDVACKELTGGTSDLVLCGGADLHNGINDYLMFSSVHALSPTGRSATFDDSADGIALGEGVACVALKRLADAERDGDRIYGVIKGVGSSSDGRALGLTAPRPEGQRRALERAYRNAGLSPAEVGLVEAHGTGTVVGDRAELGTLTEVFTEHGAGPASCSIGSVKSQIGHTKCAAGLAGLIKTVLALHTGVKPPTLHLNRPNSAWDAGTSPFDFHTAARPWAVAPEDRVAGVSAFGFGGTNFHVVLKAYAAAPPPAQTLDEWPVELFTFRGADQAAARKAAEQFRTLVLADPGKGQHWRLRDLACSAARRSDLAAGRGDRVGIALLAGDTTELAELLDRAIAGEHAPAEGIFLADSDALHGENGAEENSLAFLFPGQGSQRTGMFAELFVAFPELQHYLQLGGQWADRLYPPAAFDEQERARQREEITDTRVAQPVLGITGLAAHELLGQAGVHPDMVAGHSYGELVALTAAGVFSPETLLESSAARAAAILAATGEGDPGAMAAVSAPAPAVEDVLTGAGLAENVVTANRNSPKQTVISGPTAEVHTAVTELRGAGLGAKLIPVACAFHSPLVSAAGDEFAGVLAEVPVAEPELPVWSNRTAGTYPASAEGIRAELAAQIGAPVRFADQIEAMYEAGARVFVEAGPGSILTKLVGTILEGRPHRTIPLETSRRDGLAGFLAALGQLAVSGVDLRTGWLFRGRDAVDASQAQRPKRAGWTVDGHLIRTSTGDLAQGSLRPAQRVMETTVFSGSSAAHPQQPAPASGSEALISEFLRSSREMIAAQRDVLLGYLGAEQVPAVPQLAAPAPVTVPVAAPVPVTHAVPAPAPTPAPEPAAPAVSADAVLAAVLEIIGDRTGYPVEMIEPDLDLEADLSVDSIKRAEIAGELAARLELTATGDAELEELSKARTAAGIAGLLIARIAERGQAPVSTPDTPAAVTATVFSADAVLAAVLEIIGDRTGYPVEMIEPDLDLEADLSVDSIKRAEIAGELATRLELTGAGDAELEELSKARTAAGIAGLLVARIAEHTPVGQAPVTVPTPVVSADGVLAAVLEIIGDRTGYPVEMIEPDLDLEADLSVDSIKRAEIAGELATRLELTGAGDAELEELSKARTAAGIAGLLVARLGGAEPEPVTAPESTVSTSDGEEPSIVAPRRLMLREYDLAEPAMRPDELTGKTFLVLGEGELALALVKRIAVLGGHVTIGADGEETTQRFDGVFHLGALTDSEPLLPGAFPFFQAVLANKPRWLIAAGPADGLRGFFRTVSREYPDTVARVVESEPELPAEALAEELVAELSAVDREPVVLRSGGGRRGLRLAQTDLGLLGSTGAGPAGDGAAEVAAMGLDRDSVVLLVGGAKGITARFASTLAAASRCRIELLGRTSLPEEEESPAIAAATDPAALRAALIAGGMRAPAQIEKEIGGILAAREVRETLRQLTELGSQVRYHSVDMLDTEAVHHAVKEIHGEHGRLDGVVYAAGIIEDRLIAEKSVDSFHRVFNTKVDGARTLLDAVTDLPNGPRFAVLFGSIAAALGNRGQVDYASANDALEQLGSRWSTAGRRGVTVHWGPWAPTGSNNGMVTPELMRSYAKRGIELIDPEEGTLSLLRELAWGEETADSVVYTASGW